MMENKNQDHDKDQQENPDIDDNVGLTHDELSEIVDNIDFKEIDNLEDMGELPEGEIESVDLNSTTHQEDILVKEKAEEKAAKEIPQKDRTDTAYPDEMALANSLEESTALKKNTATPPPPLAEKDRVALPREKKLVSKEKKKGNTRSKKPAKRNAPLTLHSREVKELILFLDKQLAFIPHRKVEEFVKSKHYSTYLKLISLLKS